MTYHFAVSRQPSAVSRQPSAVSRQPSAVSRQPSAVSRVRGCCRFSGFTATAYPLRVQPATPSAAIATRMEAHHA
jgi:hypothetical protein